MRAHIGDARRQGGSTSYVRAATLCCRRSQAGIKSLPRSYFTRAAQRAGTEVGVVRANQKAAELAPVIAELRAAGITSKKGTSSRGAGRRSLEPEHYDPAGRSTRRSKRAGCSLSSGVHINSAWHLAHSKMRNRVRPLSQMRTRRIGHPHKRQVGKYTIKCR
jgi:hypothetical protein